ncbi:MAG: hypothetical protein H7143_05355 [Pseudorhodobacter sp.]|nr:hypothetical protein [Rhizobacter sp.]
MNRILHKLRSQKILLGEVRILAQSSEAVNELIQRPDQVVIEVPQSPAGYMFWAMDNADADRMMALGYSQLKESRFRAQSEQMRPGDDKSASHCAQVDSVQAEPAVHEDERAADTRFLLRTVKIRRAFLDER